MRLAAVCCALLLLFAGCGGPPDAAPSTPTAATDSPTATDKKVGTTVEPGTATASPTPTQTPEETPTETPTPSDGAVRVEGGEYPGNASLVFQRVLNLVDESVRSPTVYIESGEAAPLRRRQPSAFTEALGLTPPENASSGILAYTTPVRAEIHLYQGALATPERAESLLAHESVHVVQFRTGWARSLLRAQPRLDGQLTYDGRQTYYLVLEGAAVFVQDRYQRRYQENATPALAFYRNRYRNASPHARLGYGRYHFGGQYVAAELDSPAGLTALHESPPESSEQVLHRTEDPIADLSVNTSAIGAWRVTDSDRMGELFVRTALRTELNRSAAVAAAAGWGDDRKLTVASDGRIAHAWVLRWDDEANASEFEAAVRAYLDSKAAGRDGQWADAETGTLYRLKRPSPRTVVVLIGNESFVENASVTAEKGEVALELAAD